MKIIKLCRVTQNSADQDNFPAAQVTALGAPMDAVQLQPYGLTSRPPNSNSLGLLFNILGLEQNRMFIPFNSKLRKKGLKPGETVLENMLSGGFIYLKQNGDLQVNIPENLQTTVKAINITATGVVTITAPSGIVLAGPVMVGGLLAVGGAFACNGQTPSAPVTVNPPATNNAQAITLVNQLRAALIQFGIVQ